RRHLLELPAMRHRPLEPEERGSGGVDELDPAGRVEADDAGRHPGQHRVEETAAAFGLLVGGDELVALGLHPGSHVVEGSAEEGNLVLAVLGTDMGVEIALPYPFGGKGQTADRLREAFGGLQAEPDGADDHHEREAEIDQREFEDEPAPVGVELVVELDGLRGLVEEGEDLAIDLARDVEEAVGKGVEAMEGAEFVVGPVLDDDDLALTGAFDLLGTGRDEVEEITALAPGPQVGITIDDVGLGQGPLHLELAEGQELAQLAA